MTMKRLLQPGNRLISIVADCETDWTAEYILSHESFDFVAKKVAQQDVDEITGLAEWEAESRDFNCHKLLHIGPYKCVVKIVETETNEDGNNIIPDDSMQNPIEETRMELTARSPICYVGGEHDWLLVSGDPESDCQYTYKCRKCGMRKVVAEDFLLWGLTYGDPTTVTIYHAR